MYNVAMGTPCPGRRRLLILAAIAAVLVGGAVATLYGIPYMRHREIQHRLAAFRADPNQENADRLAEEITSRRADQGEALEILRTWLDLKAVVRPSYRPTTLIDITLTSGNRTVLGISPPTDPLQTILFCNPQMLPRVREITSSRTGYYDGSGHSMESGTVRLDPSVTAKVLFTWPSVERGSAGVYIHEPGVYTGTVVFQCAGHGGAGLRNGPARPSARLPGQGAPLSGPHGRTQRPPV